MADKLFLKYPHDISKQKPKSSLGIHTANLFFFKNFFFIVFNEFLLTIVHITQYWGKEFFFFSFEILFTAEKRHI